MQGLAVEVFTEMKDLGLELGGVERVVDLQEHAALLYITERFRQLFQHLRGQSTPPISDPERHSYESSLQKLESDLRNKIKVPLHIDRT